MAITQKQLADHEKIESALRVLSKPDAQIAVTTKQEAQAVDLPEEALDLLRHILELMAQGKSVQIISRDAELTTMQAADILNVSRPYVIKLLEAGDIPFRKVGTHRRILMQDLMAYKEANDRQRRAAMDELVALSQEMGIGYD